MPTNRRCASLDVRIDGQGGIEEELEFEGHRGCASRRGGVVQRTSPAENVPECVSLYRTKYAHQTSV